MKLKVGVLGIGNAGGQVAALAKSEGIDAIAINVSEDDTKTLEGMTTLVIGNSMGSGKNREMAKKYGKASIRKLIEQADFDKFIKGCQAVFVVYSTGGGTGSALGPMVTAVLKAQYKSDDESKRIRFLNVGILPALKETLHAQENTMSTIKELASYDSCFGLYDNDHYSDLAVEKMMESVNRDIVEDIKVIRGDYNLLTKFNSIDTQDMLNILSFDGMFRIISAVGFQEKDLDKKPLEDMLLQNLTEGAGCELDRDHTIKCMAPIVNVRPEVSDFYDSGLPKVKETVGEPPVGFEHYFVIGKDEEHLLNRVHVIMTGLSLPDDRLTKINQRIAEAEEALNAKKESSALQAYDKAHNFVGEANAQDNSKDTLDDILSKF